MDQDYVARDQNGREILRVTYVNLGENDRVVGVVLPAGTTYTTYVDRDGRIVLAPHAVG